MRKLLAKHRRNRPWGLILGMVLLLVISSTAYAWTTAVRYVHDYQTSWSADDGYHRGQVEWIGGVRYIRAGDDYVKWNSYTSGGSGYLAMVYHSFQRNTNSCGDVRVGPIGWSWSNFSNPIYSTKGCGLSTDNEWRVEIRDSIVVGNNYWFQHVFQDTNNMGGTGEITTNTYWVSLTGGSGPYHGKFCINNTTVYAPSSGSC